MASEVATELPPQETQVTTHEDELAAAMEDLDGQLDALQSKDQCSWCLLYKESLDMKKHGKKQSCKACASIQQMLWRHLGSSDIALASFTNSEQVEFFQDAAKTVDMETGGRWKLLKTVLVEKKSRIVERLQSVAVGGDYLPMSVWEKRGWDKDDVLSFNDWEELPNGTKVYRCHIKSKTDAENKRNVEESLLERERECKKRRVPKAKAKGKGKLGGLEETAVDKLESDRWLVQTDSETEMPKRTEPRLNLISIIGRCLTISFFSSVVVL